jgi:hypothetical protein
VLGDEPLSPILAAGDLAYLAVTSKTGPMVTPVLFAARDDRLWMVLPRTSAKVAAIGRDALVGVTVTTPAATAVLQGEARVVDPLDPSSLVSSLPEALLSPRAATSYLADNLAHLPDLIRSGVTTRRAMAAVRPARALVVRGTDDVWADGDWPAAARVPAGGAAVAERVALEVDDDTAAPPQLLAATDRPAPVIVGWETARGPVALPGAWDPNGRVASVRADVFAAAGAAPSGGACVVFDLTEGTALDAKAGVVLRGPATAHARDDDAVDLAVSVERVTWWQGDRAKTLEAR